MQNILIDTTMILEISTKVAQLAGTGAVAYLPYLAADGISKNLFDNIPLLKSGKLKNFNPRMTPILMTVSATTVAVLLILIMPTLFHFLENVANNSKSLLNVNIGGLHGDNLFSFNNSRNTNQLEGIGGILAQIGSAVQKIGPMLAVAIGGVKLMSSMNKGMMAIEK